MTPRRARSVASALLIGAGVAAACTNPYGDLRFSAGAPDDQPARDAGATDAGATETAVTGADAAATGADDGGGPADASFDVTSGRDAP